MRSPLSLRNPQTTTGMQTRNDWHHHLMTLCRAKLQKKGEMCEIIVKKSLWLFHQNFIHKLKYYLRVWFLTSKFFYRHNLRKESLLIDKMPYLRQLICQLIIFHFYTEFDFFKNQYPKCPNLVLHLVTRFWQLEKSAVCYFDFPNGWS